MSYKIGVSSGWWKIARSPDIMGFAQKVSNFGGTAGVQLIQVDLETTSEFYEPQLKSQMNRIEKELGMEMGLHGEEGELMALESAEKRIWEQSHLRLIETVKSSIDFGLKYINFHSSNKPLISFVEAQQRIQGYFYPVVAPDGKSITTLAKYSATRNEMKKHVSSTIYRSGGETWKNEVRALIERKQKEFQKRVKETLEEIEKEGRQVDRRMVENAIRQEISDEIERKKQDRDFWYDVWVKMKDTEHDKYILEDGELGAYLIVATYMKETGDSLWNMVNGGGDPETAYFKQEQNFCAAVSSKYIEGHLTVKDHPLNIKHLNGMSVKEYIESRGNTMILFETPQVQEGLEGLMRMYDPIHIYYFVKKMNSPKIKMCIDFEHVISHKVHIEDFIKALPGDGGSAIKLFHVTKPVPYGGTVHYPLSIGSRSQEIIYKWLYALRKKGFRDGYIIFERGGGKTPLEIMGSSVWVLRQIAEYLEQDVKPDNLPEKFYGIAEQNKEVFSKQLVSIREHAWDPLQGLLSVPDEEHTFLSKAALEKGKAEQWKKGRYR